MMLVKVGGPVYRIGVGGGAASSVAVQGGDSRDHALDFGAVQRGEITNKNHKMFYAAFQSHTDSKKFVCNFKAKVIFISY